jgi:hypothetical protein
MTDDGSLFCRVLALGTGCHYPLPVDFGTMIMVKELACHFMSALVQTESSVTCIIIFIQYNLYIFCLVIYFIHFDQNGVARLWIMGKMWNTGGFFRLVLCLLTSFVWLPCTRNTLNHESPHMSLKTAIYVLDRCAWFPGNNLEIGSCGTRVYVVSHWLLRTQGHRSVLCCDVSCGLPLYTEIFPSEHISMAIWSA